MKEFSFEVIGNICTVKGTIVGEVRTSMKGSCSDAVHRLDLYNEALRKANDDFRMDMIRHETEDLLLMNVQVITLQMGGIKC